MVSRRRDASVVSVRALPALVERIRNTGSPVRFSFFFLCHDFRHPFAAQGKWHMRSKDTFSSARKEENDRYEEEERKSWREARGWKHRFDSMRFRVPPGRHSPTPLHPVECQSESRQPRFVSRFCMTVDPGPGVSDVEMAHAAPIVGIDDVKSLEQTRRQFPADFTLSASVLFDERLQPDPLARSIAWKRRFLDPLTIIEICQLILCTKSEQ